MVYPALQRDMLPNADRHVLCRCHVDDRRLSGVSIRNPKRDREPVCRAAEGDRDCAHEVEEERREAILVCCRIRPVSGYIEERIEWNGVL